MPQNSDNTPYLLITDLKGDQTKEGIFRLCLRLARVRQVQEGDQPNQYTVHFLNETARQKAVDGLQQQTGLQIDMPRKEDAKDLIQEKINKFVEQFNQKRQQISGGAATAVVGVSKQKLLVHDDLRGDRINNNTQPQQIIAPSPPYQQQRQVTSPTSSSERNRQKPDYSQQQQMYKQQQKRDGRAYNNHQSNDFFRTTNKSQQQISNRGSSPQKTNKDHESTEDSYENSEVDYDADIAQNDQNQFQQQKSNNDKHRKSKKNRKNKKKKNFTSNMLQHNDKEEFDNLNAAMPDLSTPTGSIVATFNNAKVNTHENTLNSGQCQHCAVICHTVCERCSAFFCSIKCQIDNWQKHRYVCDRYGLLPLCPTETIKATQDISNVMKQQDNLLYIINVLKANLVIVRSGSQLDEQTFENLKQNLQDAGKTAKPLQKLPQIGTLVMIEYKTKYYRVLVQKVENIQQIQVFYQDYGDVRSVTFKEMFELPEHLCFVPRQAVPVLLKYVADTPLAKNICEYFSKLIQNKTQLRLKNDKDWLENKDKKIPQAVLFECSTDACINDEVRKLQRLNNSQQQQLNAQEQQQQHQQQTRSEYIKERSSFQSTAAYNTLIASMLPLGKNIRLVILNNFTLISGIIYCSTEESLVNINNLQMKLQTFMSDTSMPDYTPTSIDELCFVKCANKLIWYRGRVIAMLPNNNFEIQCIDYGHSMTVSTSLIRKFDETFSQPIYAAECIIKDLPMEIDATELPELLTLFKARHFIDCDNVEYNEKLKIYILTLTRYLTKRGYFKNIFNEDLVS